MICRLPTGRLKERHQIGPSSMYDEESRQEGRTDVPFIPMGTPAGGTLDTFRRRALCGRFTTPRPAVKTGNGSASVDPADHEGTVIAAPTTFGQAATTNNQREGCDPARCRWGRLSRRQLNIKLARGPRAAIRTPSFSDNTLGQGRTSGAQVHPGDNEPANRGKNRLGHELLRRERSSPNFITPTFRDRQAERTRRGSRSSTRCSSRLPSRRAQSVDSASTFSSLPLETAPLSTQRGRRARSSQPYVAGPAPPVALGSSIAYSTDPTRGPSLDFFKTRSTRSCARRCNSAD